MKRTFQVVIERDEDGVYIASVPSLPGCRTQANSMKELEANIKEAIEAYLESMDKNEPVTRFVKIKKVQVAIN